MLIQLCDQLQERLSKHHENPSAERAVELLHQAGIMPLGLGARRVVVALDDDRVAKLAWRSQGLLDNEIEWRLYHRAVDDLKRLLCPALERRESRVLIQRRCLPVAFEAAGEAGREAMSRLASYGVSDVAVNLGLIDEHLVCYDYCVLKPELFSDLFGELPTSA